MKVDIESQIVIRCAREQVAAYATNPDNVTRWCAKIKSVAWKTAPPLDVGSQVAFVADFLGRRFAYTYEIVTLVPSERLVMRTSEGPFPMETSYRWESTSGGSTRMILRNRGDAIGFAGSLRPIPSDSDAPGE